MDRKEIEKKYLNKSFFAVMPCSEVIQGVQLSYKKVLTFKVLAVFFNGLNPVTKRLEYKIMAENIANMEVLSFEEGQLFENIEDISKDDLMSFDSYKRFKRILE